MSSDYPSIDGVSNFYISSSRGEFPISIIIQAVSLNQSVIVFDIGLSKKMGYIFFGVIKPFFGINIIGFTGNCRRAKKVRMPRITVIIQMIGLNDVFWICDGNCREKLKLFLGNIIFSRLAL